MDQHENKHCVETKYSCRYHYIQTVDTWRACGEKDDFNRIELKPKGPGYPQLAFEMPRQRMELEKVERLMQLAYERGRLDNRNELAALLKNLINI
jgi:hypothetical protein